MRICTRRHKYDYDWASLTRAYREYVRPDATVLEIGASVVERTKELSRDCGHLIGLELVPERTPDDFGNVAYVTGDWQELDRFVEPGTIDVAIASHVIEHVPDDLESIDQLYTALKPSGVALLNTPNRKRLVRAVIEAVTREREFPYWEHLREYTEEDLLALLEASRFNDYLIKPLVFGVHGGPLFVYRERVPAGMRRYANYWEIHLFKR